MWPPAEERVLQQVYETRFGSLVHKVLSNPRMIMFAFGTLMTAIAASTWVSEPGYLVWPMMYVIVGAIGAAASFWAAITPGKWTLAIAGSTIAGAVSARGIGLMLSAFDGPWRGDTSWTFIVGALAYFVILTMLPPVWFRYLIPWAVEKVR